MVKEEKLTEKSAYHPEKFDKTLPLLPNKPSEEFVLDEGLTLITMDNLRKLDQWEKRQK